ncbi:MAG: hypothetical protein AAGG48_07900 [Planctomycetota bacterium]
MSKIPSSVQQVASQEGQKLTSQGVRQTQQVSASELGRHTSNAPRDYEVRAMQQRAAAKQQPQQQSQQSQRQTDYSNPEVAQKYGDMPQSRESSPEPQPQQEQEMT